MCMTLSASKLSVDTTKKVLLAFVNDRMFTNICFYVCESQSP